MKDLSEFYEPPLTIRIQNPIGGVPFTTNFATILADTYLFHIADVSHLSIEIASNQDPRGERVIYSPNGIEPPEKMGFPKSVVNRELVNYFTRALNGAIPELQIPV